LRIGDREIGMPNRDCAGVYVIAELGVNHDGRLDRALELTQAAADAGADAVKLQYFETDRLLSSAAKLAAYQQAAGEADPVEMLRRLELPLESMARVIEKAHALGLHALVTVFSVELVGRAAELPWDAFKSASPDIVHRPLLEALAATGRPLLVSTGASEMDEIERAASWLRNCGARERTALLHCVSSYPAAPADAALLGIVALRRAFDVPIGYSDHTCLDAIGAAAVACGAAVLEKHLTYDPRAAGPDHAASLGPRAFARYAGLAKQVPRDRVLPAHADPVLDDRYQMTDDSDVLGALTKRVLPCEREVRMLSRQSIVSRRGLQQGEVIRADDLTFKRPGTGLPPCEIEHVIGRRLRRAVKADTPLVAEDLA